MVSITLLIRTRACASAGVPYGSSGSFNAKAFALSHVGRSFNGFMQMLRSAARFVKVRTLNAVLQQHPHAPMDAGQDFIGRMCPGPIQACNLHICFKGKLAASSNEICFRHNDVL